MTIHIGTCFRFYMQILYMVKLLTIDFILECIWKKQTKHLPIECLQGTIIIYSVQYGRKGSAKSKFIILIKFEVFLFLIANSHLFSLPCIQVPFSKFEHCEEFREPCTSRALSRYSIWEKGRSLKQIHSTNSDRKQLTWGTHSIGDDRQNRFQQMCIV